MIVANRNGGRGVAVVTAADCNEKLQQKFAIPISFVHFRALSNQLQHFDGSSLDSSDQFDPPHSACVRLV